MSDLDQLLDHLRAAPVVLVTVVRAEGSVPREPGAWMAVQGGRLFGTIGGGRLEHEAIALANGGQLALPHEQRFALGPSLGQCCGGVAWLRFEAIDASQSEALRARLAEAATPVALFGGGHVGRALVRLAAELPWRVHWIDSRDEVFPESVPANVRCEHSDPVQAAVATLAPGSLVAVMSFSHAEDLDIMAACLARQRAQGDLPYIGLIGSATKWATFRKRLTARGFTEAELAQVVCPIGVPGIAGKQPAVVALAVAAQLLQQGTDKRT